MPSYKPHNHRQKHRNLFSIFAVLAAAGATVGICSLVLNLADTIGGAPTPIALSNDADNAIPPEQTLSTEGSTLSASVTSPATLPISTVLGRHLAPVVAISAPQAISADATETPLAITGSYDNTVRVWATDGSAELSALKELAHNSYVNDIALISNRLAAGSVPLRLATGSGSGEIKLWDLDSGALITTIADNSGRVLSISANADGDLIASGSSNGTLKVWPVEAIAAQKSQTNLRGQALQISGPALTALAFHPTDPNLLISGDRDGTLHIWDIARSQIMLTLASSPLPSDTASEPDSRSIASISISPNGRHVASVSNQLIHIWDIDAGKLVRTLSGHRAAITAATFSADGTVLASSSADQTVKTWDWAQGLVFCTLSDRSGPIQAIAFANDADTLISGSDDGTVRAWDLSRDSNSACLGK